MSNVIDMDEWVQRENSKLVAHEEWEYELAIATAHSVGQLYIDKLKGIYPEASEALLIYKVLGGLLGRTCELLADGDPAAPAVIGWLDFIANDIADKDGIDLSDDAMDDAMGHMYAHRLNEPTTTEQ